MTRAHLPFAFALTLSGAVGAHAASVDAVAVFNAKTGGARPSSAPAFGANGLLYGTTISDDQAGHGVIYRLDPSSGALTTLYTFQGGNDGATPGPVIFFKGNLYGTTSYGGQYGYGTAYRANPTSGKLTVLHQFTDSDDGARPMGKLLATVSGILYGTTFAGGSDGGGIVFSLNPQTDEFQTIHSFGPNEGAFPAAGLAADAQGVLYGTTSEGGTNGFNTGTVFKVDPSTGAFSTLCAFVPSEPYGISPYSTPALDLQHGLLFGTNTGGGTNNHGTVFKLNLATEKVTTLHAFQNTSDGTGPWGSVSLRKGTLYGVTISGGSVSGGGGEVYSIKESGTGFTPLATLDTETGYATKSDLIFDTSGRLYGAAPYGGLPAGVGTVFEVIP